jgi:GntR family transcriptional regulator
MRASAVGADGAQLHRKSFVPLYFQLAEVLKERIEGGEWAPGSRFLSERELCAEFGISRTVVRPALTMLEGDGQLVRIKGRGTFVTPPKVLDRIRGLTRRLSATVPAGEEIRLLHAGQQRPEPHVAQTLGIDRREKVAHVTTMTRAGRRPLFLCDSFISLAWVPTVLDVVTDGNRIDGGTPARLPLKLQHSRVGIQTSFCSEFEAKQLEIAAGGLVFLIRCVEYARTRAASALRPVEVARIVYRADTVELEADLL